jgi:hypothetical protein
MRIPVVLPTQIEWVFLFVLIGIFGFVAQVLLTLGLQRETAGRGTMAIYVQVSWKFSFKRSVHSWAPLRVLDRLRHNLGIPIFPYDASVPFCIRNGDNHWRSPICSSKCLSYP